jgi:hypothetical protein
MKAESRQQPGEATARRHPLTGIVPVIEDHRTSSVT